MARYFLDTSALVKRYITQEVGYAWVVSLCTPAAGNAIVVSELAVVEATAAFTRMARETPLRLDVATRDALIATFRGQHIQKDYLVIPVTRTLLERAADLCLKDPLRAYDATQLASALQARDDALAAGDIAPIFVCADNGLLTAASAEGMTTDNPIAHP